MKRLTVCVVVIMLIAAAASLPFVLNAGFGQAPQGAQLSLVEQSPHYRDGQFHNQVPTPGYTGNKGMLAAWWSFWSLSVIMRARRSRYRWWQPISPDFATAGYSGLAGPLLMVFAAGGSTYPD